MLAWERAVFEDPGSAWLLLSWGAAALRAADRGALDAALARAARSGHDPAVTVVLRAFAQVADGGPAAAAVASATAQLAALEPPADVDLAHHALQQALAPRSAWTQRCPPHPDPWACLATAPTAALDEALRASAGADPTLRLWLAERRWIEAEGPTGAILQDTLRAAAAAGDEARLRCWAALAASDPRRAEPDSSALPPLVRAAPQPDPRAPALQAALQANARRWAPCPTPLAPPSASAAPAVVDQPPRSQ